MKKILFIIVLVPFLLGNKSCEKSSGYGHPEVPEGISCATCHEDGRTRETKPKGHTLAWQRDHGKWIHEYGFKPDSTCMLCHRQSQCTSCHQQQPPRDHTNFWRLKGHGAMVGLDRSRCFTCHRGVDFCERCHADTKPLNHTAAWGTPTNQHCLSCHFPLTSVGAQQCAVCHTSTPSHTNAPTQPSNALHLPGADCRGCHTPLRHPDNGMACTVCHSR